MLHALPRGGLGLLLLSLLLPFAAEARARHHHIRVPSSTSVVSNAMGRLEAMGDIEDETSRLQSTYEYLSLFLCVMGVCMIERDSLCRRLFLFVDRWRRNHSSNHLLTHLPNQSTQSKSPATCSSPRATATRRPCSASPSMGTYVSLSTPPLSTHPPTYLPTQVPVSPTYPFIPPTHPLPPKQRDHCREALLRQHHQDVLRAHRRGGGQVEEPLHPHGRPRRLHLRHQGTYLPTHPPTHPLYPPTSFIDPPLYSTTYLPTSPTHPPTHPGAARPARRRLGCARS